ARPSSSQRALMNASMEAEGDSSKKAAFYGWAKLSGSVLYRLPPTVNSPHDRSYAIHLAPRRYEPGQPDNACPYRQQPPCSPPGGRVLHWPKRPTTCHGLARHPSDGRLDAANGRRSLFVAGRTAVVPCSG